MKIILYALFFTLSLVHFSCQDGISDCFTRNGGLTAVEYEVLPFDQIHVYDGLHVIITQGDAYKVTVKAGEHIISDIKVKNEEGILSLTDEITCNWARRYEPKEVYVQCPDVRTIYQNGYGTISSGHVLTLDSLSIRPRYGHGNVTLQLDTKYTEVISHRNGTVTLTGNTHALYVALLYEIPIFDGRNFKASHVSITHQGNNSIHVYPIISLKGKLSEKGNIYFYHPPQHMDIEITGEGKVIDHSANT